MDFLNPHYAHSALVIIDFQNDCILPGAPMEVSGSLAVLPALADLAKAARAQRRPVIHILRAYLPDASNADRCRRAAIAGGLRLLQPDTAGADFPDVLKPAGAPPLAWPQLLAGEVQRLGDFDYALYKPRWGAFYATPLENLLAQLAIDTLIIAGCNFPNCPRATLYEASERDFRLVLATDALSGLYTRGLEEINAIGVTTCNSAAICHALAETQP